MSESLSPEIEYVVIRDAPVTRPLEESAEKLGQLCAPDPAQLRGLSDEIPIEREFVFIFFAGDAENAFRRGDGSRCSECNTKIMSNLPFIR